MKGGGARRIRLFTVGHSDRDPDDFLDLLEGSSVRVVADIRSNPASARFPHFERRALAASLDERGVAYRWFRELGGRRPPTPGEEEQTAFGEEWMRRYAAAMSTPEFVETVGQLEGIAASTVVALLCAEREFARCHRWLLADLLVSRGARVVHVVDEETAVEHVPHPDLFVEEGGRLVYRRKQLDLLS
jgi:uncharacterized protein (DUF488 family)